MSKYRIVEHHQRCFEPQIKRWWWPFWRHIASTSYTGYDWSPMSHSSRADAELAIAFHKSPTPTSIKIHEVP